MTPEQARAFCFATLREHDVTEMCDILLRLLERGAVSRREFSNAVARVRRDLLPEEAARNALLFDRLREAERGQG